MRRCCPTLPLVLCAAAVSLSSSGCGASALLVGRFDPPQVSIGKSYVAKLTRSAATLSIDLDVFNPNPYRLQVRGLEYRLSTAGARLAEGSVSDVIDLPGDGRSTVTLPVYLDLQALARAAQTVLALGEVPYDLEVRCTVGTLFAERALEQVDSSVLRLGLPVELTWRRNVRPSQQLPAG
jgi:LEA14-like dessication related protein